MPTDVQRIQSVFLAAVEIRDPVDRARFLDRACDGDAELRSRVEALLRAHDQPDSLLDHPAVAPHDPDSDPTDTIGHESGAGAEEVPLGFLEPATRPDSLGRLGHYEVLQVLGQGGFGIVFRAFDDVLQRVVAVKVLSPQMAATSPARKRFLREARSSAQVRHENVVQVYEVGEQPLPFLVMEFIPGETLQQRLDRVGPVEPAEVVRVGRQIAEGLAAAHAHGLIHRDIKPANVLLESGARGHVKLTDFGLALAADDASLTQSGVVAGTPMYMAPEQAKGQKLDQRADLFSLGSVLYVMATGRPPFRAASTYAVLKRVVEDTPRPIQEVIPEVPSWLCRIIARLQAKKPEDRIATAGEVAEMLAQGLEALQRPEPPMRGEPTSPLPPTSSNPQSAIRKPQSARWVVAAAVLLLVLGGLGFTEATGVTRIHGTVIRLFTPQGTLEIQVADPNVSVRIDGSDLVITGAGAREIRLPVGQYTVQGIKDGKVVSRELVTVTKDGKQIVRVSQEAPARKDDPAAKVSPQVQNPPTASAPFTDADIKRIAALPPAERCDEVMKELNRRNPGYEGKGQFGPVKENGEVTGFIFSSVAFQEKLTDIAPLRALPLKTLHIFNQAVSDLSPLRGMALTDLALGNTKVADLTPLKGMPLRKLSVSRTPVTDLSPLRGMKLESLKCSRTKVSDLSPLRGMPLTHLDCVETLVTDLSPLQGMKLTHLDLIGTAVADLSPLKDMPLIWVRLVKRNAERDAPILRAIPTLKTINGKPAAEFWKDLEAKQKGTDR